MMKNRFYLISILSICYLILGVSAQAQSDINLTRIRQATVFIYQVIETQDNFIISCVSTGTVVGSEGLILTNAHSIVTSRNCPGDTLIIGLGTNPETSPLPLYIGDIVQVDQNLDLVLVRIARTISGRKVTRNELNLPSVEVGNSSTVNLDDTIFVAGYAELADDPVEIIQGTVVNFIAETRGGDKAWIKTNASIPGLMSGGGAYNRFGQLIGIPTTTPSYADDSPDCQYMQDTSGDGIVTENDRCIAVANFVNVIRPIDFAKPLIRASTLGLVVNSFNDDRTASDTLSPDLEPQISRLFFAPSVNEANMPTTIISSAPTGTRSLYLFFDYVNMDANTTYELRVSNNNIPNSIFSLAPVKWSGNKEGVWYIGSSGITWPNGIYDFTIFVNGIAQSTASIIIGGAPGSTPTIADLTFGIADLDGAPLGNGYVLPTGFTASARFIYRNIPSDAQWLARWFYNGNEVFRTPVAPWTDGSDGAKTITIQDSSGLVAGQYRLEIYINNRLASTSDFTLAGTPEGVYPQVYNELRFISAATREEAIGLTESSTTFSSGLDSLFFIFDWNQIELGTNWAIRWFVDNDLFFEQVSRWDDGRIGRNLSTELTQQSGTIPDGTYRVDLYIDNVLLATSEATIGIGQLPIDSQQQIDGLQLEGQIIDIDTGKGLSGATFILISEDFSVADFVWDMNQIHGLGTTDRNGYFQLETLLNISTEQLPVPYSVIIAMDGYKVVQADGFVVNETTPNPLYLTIYVQQES